MRPRRYTFSTGTNTQAIQNAILRTCDLTAARSFIVTRLVAYIKPHQPK